MSMNRLTHHLRRSHSDAKDGPLRHRLRAAFMSRPRCEGRWWICLTVLSSCALCIVDSGAFAQPPGGPMGGKKGGMPTAPGFKKPATPSKKVVEPELNIDPEFLPRSFEAPPESLAIMELEQPIATPEELSKLQKAYIGGG